MIHRSPEGTGPSPGTKASSLFLLPGHLWAPVTIARVTGAELRGSRHPLGRPTGKRRPSWSWRGRSRGRRSRRVDSGHARVLPLPRRLTKEEPRPLPSGFQLGSAKRRHRRKAGGGRSERWGASPQLPPTGELNRTASCPGAPRGDPGTPLSLLDLQAWGQGRRCPRHLDVWSVLPASVTSPVCLPPRASRHQSSGLTSCSERPSMISDTSCSLRAADMDSPLPRWPTLLETRGTQLGPGPRQPGCRPAPRPTPEAAASPDVACGRRGGAGAPVPQGQPQPGVQGRTWAPDPGSAAPEPSFLSNKAQPHRSTSRPQSCLCGPAPQFPSVTWR